MQRVTAALCQHISSLLEADHPSVAKFQSAYGSVSLPPPRPCGVQYWGCELRQLEERLAPPVELMGYTPQAARNGEHDQSMRLPVFKDLFVK